MPHDGTHGDNCFGCKVKTLQFDDGNLKSHVHNGSHWDNNPVVERAMELQAQGLKVTTNAAV